MKLPKRQNAYIPQQKLKDYLLSRSHPIGSWKSKLFHNLGFDETNSDLLEQHLFAIANSENVNESIMTKYGTKYVIDGSIKTPNGNILKLRTIWIIEERQNNPRFVTAYPVLD
ncbi:DUF6883 domain-containing protein [Thermodesulfobacteriota bacterium]